MGKNLWPLRTIRAGEKLNSENIGIKSPQADGLPPYFWDEVIGKITIHDLSTAEPLKEEDIDGK